MCEMREWRKWKEKGHCAKVSVNRLSVRFRECCIWFKIFKAFFRNSKQQINEFSNLQYFENFPAWNDAATQKSIESPTSSGEDIEEAFKNHHQFMTKIEETYAVAAEQGNKLREVGVFERLL